MKRYLIILILLSLHFTCSFPATSWLAKLDSAISMRQKASAVKERRILLLKRKCQTTYNKESRLKYLSEIFEEYQTYHYDSAMTYALRWKTMADKLGNGPSSLMATIRMAQLNANGGYYMEAEKTLNRINPDDLTPVLKKHYYLANFWLYMYMGQYISNAKEDSLKTAYRQKMNASLCEAIRYADPNSAEYQYLMGEKKAIIDNDNESSLPFYLRVIARVPLKSKLYASAAFSIAGCYKAAGNMEEYEQWAAKAAISDMLMPIKDNYALQDLAMYLFNKKDPDIIRASTYIYTAQEDAMFFGSHLRMIEISKKMSAISVAYANKIKSQKRFLVYAFIGLALLFAIVLISILLIKKQNNKLNHLRQELQEKNEELTLKYKESNEHRRELTSLNGMLTTLNKELKNANSRLNTANSTLNEINNRREGLAKVYIDLCAKYIERLHHYKTLVQRKIKTNKVNELLQTVSSERLSEEEAAAFITRFDKAFLDLYPTFVESLNTLLRADAQIEVKQPGTLTPELRIYALIHLGVKDSTEIAALLFYSPQTIYNYRSAIRNKAINKETLDHDVRHLRIEYK